MTLPYIAAFLWASTGILYLVVLYMLKLRRDDYPVSSSLLWRKAINDYRVNHPFQRFKSNLLLLLQCLFIMLIALTVGGLTFEGWTSYGMTNIILIDNSLSMNATLNDGRTRLDHAKDMAKDFVENMSGSDRACVIAFSDRAIEILSLTNSKSDLRAAIESGISPTDRQTDAKEAFRRIYAEFNSERLKAENLNPPQVVMFSDGRMPELPSNLTDETPIEVIYNPVGDSMDNVAITVLDVRAAPSYAHSRVGTESGEITETEAYHLFALVKNFSANEKTITLAITHNTDPDLRANRAEKIATEFKTIAGFDPDNPSKNEATLSLLLYPLPEGLLSVKIEEEDALMTDNVAKVFVRAPKVFDILLVYSPALGNAFLDRTLDSMTRLISVSKTTIDDFNANPISLCEQFDLVIFDRVQPVAISPGSYAFVHTLPNLPDFVAGPEVSYPNTVLTTIGNTENASRLLKFTGWNEFWTISANPPAKLPVKNETLLGCGSGPLISISETDAGHRVLHFAFDLLKSNIMVQRTWIIFFSNMLDYFAHLTGEEGGIHFRPGDVVTIKGDYGIDEGEEISASVSIAPSFGSVLKETSKLTSTMQFAGTDVAGIYRLDVKEPGDVRFAVNPLGKTEGDLRIADSIKFDRIDELIAGESYWETNLNFWPYLVALALLVLFIEWFFYQKRVF
ncbi:MAG: VWA domain-containing protein [Planctomycetes bacterium]|nr:VWA domain-containing protein [Planctomycetota bacterium]